MSITGHIGHCHRVLDETPDDWDTRLMLADLLDEAGETEFAECQRWMVENERYPLYWGVQPVSWEWNFYGEWRKNEPLIVHWLLPHAIGKHLVPEGEYMEVIVIIAYPTRLEAEQELSDALVKAGVANVT